MSYGKIVTDENAYKEEINTMLIALGCGVNEAKQIITDHEIQIQAWTSGSKGEIVTAAIAARIFLGNKGMTPLYEIC